jgi:hypothetical protein
LAGEIADGEEAMSVIEGASVSARTMADGTLRLSIDIEPRNAQAAFVLFGAPGRAVALAALKDGSAAITSESASEVKEKQQKGGEWAKLAGMWCNDQDFWAFLNQTYPADSTVRTADHAAMALRVHCDIASRAELDHSPEALELFQIRLRRPFMKWMQARGIQK